jgi:vitamin B12 transporter
MAALPISTVNTDQIVITASRMPDQKVKTPASVTIIDKKRIERFGEPLVAPLLRLSPSISVSNSGPMGSLTEVRIRGAEANHTLLFVDGIKINDPASGDTPRFELLNADLASRIEVVRGPQSALWGSEAIGGVIAVNGVTDEPGYSASVEGGSFAFERGSASDVLSSDRASLAGALGWQRAAGINSVSGPGDKDGYRNLSGRVRGTWTPAPDVELGAVGLLLTGRSEFDGFDAITFAHTDTLDNNRNRLGAGRIWVTFGSPTSPWAGQMAASTLSSSNLNFVGNDETNRTSGTRGLLSAQLERRFTTGPIAHTLIAEAETERETFHARDTAFGGFTDQDRTRDHRAVTVEWRGETRAITGDVAVRRDMFNRFANATTLRASLLGDIGAGFSVAGSYGEGISQPTFFDLFGFFPNSFVGNPSLKPESSRGFEASLRYRRGSFQASLTGYRQRLHDEIVDIFDPVTFLLSTANRQQVSHRSGVEAELAWLPSEKLRLTATYAYLNATQPVDDSTRQVRELRRPKNSGSVALDGIAGRITYGASVAYVGRHFDDRDTFPFDPVALGAYWLATAKAAYSLTPSVQLFARITNVLNQKYQDVFSYRTEPRGIFVGMRLANGR